MQHTGGQDDLPLLLDKVDCSSTDPSVPCIEDEQELHLHNLRERFWGTLPLCPLSGVAPEQDLKLQSEDWDDVAAIVIAMAIATALPY